MCVIVHKPTGVSLPSEKILKKCWKTNPDGAGIMLYRPGEGLFCYKGFMDYETLEHKLDELNIAPDDSAAIHFRIKTSGKTDPLRTHPFPIVESFIEMKSLNFTPEMALMHNGVLGQGIGSNSDTMVFISKFLKFPLFSHVFDSSDVKELLEKISTGSRLLLFSNDGKSVMTGSWTKKDKVFYSNTNWDTIRTYRTYTRDDTVSEYYGHYGAYYEKIGDIVKGHTCPTCQEKTNIKVHSTPSGTDYWRKYACGSCGCIFNMGTIFGYIINKRTK